MILKNFLPKPCFEEYVQFYRIVHFNFEGIKQQPVKHYAPRPEHCLAFYPYDKEIINYNNSKQVNVMPALLSGQQLSISKRSIVGNKFLSFQIIFKPAGLYRLTGIPSYELTNDFVDADLIFPGEVNRVNEELCETTDYAVMITIVEQFMHRITAKKIKEPHHLDKIGEFIFSDKNITIDQLAQSSFLCTKQYQRKFKERIGITPKLFERAARFEKSIYLKLKNPDASWEEIAFTCNYTNYQHMVIDYKDFTGITPTAYYLLDKQSPEKIMGIAEESYRIDKIGSL